MKTPEGPEIQVFATGARRMKSRRIYLWSLRLCLLPIATIMGFVSGSLLADVGLPRGPGLLLSLILGPGLPWLALRAIHRRSRFWYALHPDGLEVGPRKYGWRVPYEQVALIEESHSSVEDRLGCFLKVAAGSRSAKVFLEPDDVRACADALVECCPWAVWVDALGDVHLPTAPEDDPTSAWGRRAIENMAILRRRYARLTVVLGAVLLASVVGLAVAMGASLGYIRMTEEARQGLAIVSMVFAIRFGIYAWPQAQQWRSWVRLCERSADASASTSKGDDPKPWWDT